MFRILALLVFILVSFSANAQRPMVVYYESWSADKSAQDLVQLPSYITHLMISFAKPNVNYVKGSLNLSGTGLNLPYPGEELKTAIKTAKQKNPNLKVLIAVGGATYHEWQSLNATGLVDLVTDLGLDGIDIDYERTPPDAKTVDQVTQTLRQKLPSHYQLTMAVMHVTAYGKDEWQNSQPSGSDWTGFLHEINQSLSHLSMIHVMSYDAGSSYDPIEAYSAFRFYYSGVIAMGMEVPPEAWGDHRWTVPKVEWMPADIRMNSDTDRLMLWSMHKRNDQVSDSDPEWPSANLLASTACTELSLADLQACDQPLIEPADSTLTFKNDAYQSKGAYFVVDATPYGYPRTPSIKSGEQYTLTGKEIPVEKNIPVYVNALGFETACIDSKTGKEMTLSWKPNDHAWVVSFWLGQNNVHFCSASNLSFR